MPDHPVPQPIRKRNVVLRWLAAFALSVATAYVLATITATQSALSSLAGMGFPVDFPTRLSVTAQDLVGMGGIFLPLIAAGLLAAFLVVSLLCRWWPQQRLVLTVAGGAVALLAIHILMKQSFGITLIAIGRTQAGLLIQAAAGAVGGYVFVRVFSPRPQSAA